MGTMDGKNLRLVMSTKSGTQLFFNRKTGKFSSENRKDVVQALIEDMHGKDKIAADFASNLHKSIMFLGWE